MSASERKSPFAYFLGMKILNNKYSGSTWSNGKHPKQIVFDELTEEQVPFLEFAGFEFLILDVCNKCEKQKCICSKSQPKEKKRKEANDSDK